MREGGKGAWDNAVTACSSILCPQSQLGWDGMKVLGLLPAAPSLACPQPWLWGALQVCTAILCPLGLWGPPPPCCPPAQPPHSSGALERCMGRGDPRARSPEPTLSPNSARLGTGQPQALCCSWCGLQGPLRPLWTGISRSAPGGCRPLCPRCSWPVCPARHPMVLTPPTPPSVRQPPAASGASPPGPSPRGSPGSLPHAGLGVRAFCSPSLLSRTRCT